MNIIPFRSSFNVFVLDSQLERGQTISSSIGLAGYSCEHRLFKDSFFEEIERHPPHIITVHENDPHFFSSQETFKLFLDKIFEKLPEVRLILLTRQDRLSSSVSYYEDGIFDCVVWPTEHPIQLLRAIDRAAECDYFLFLNEQLRQKSTGSSEEKVNLSLFRVWQKELELAKSPADLIQLFMSEIKRYLQNDEAIYFSYKEFRKTLVVEQSIGIANEFVDGIGIQLAEREPGFTVEQLQKPHLLRSLHQFVIEGLLRKQAVYFSLTMKKQIRGIFVFPARQDQIFRDDQNEDGYILSCLHSLVKSLELFEVEQKFARLSIHDEESEVINRAVFERKLQEEVTRSRRIGRPVSVILLAVHQLRDLSLSTTNVRFVEFLRTFGEIMIKNSRINDLVGRMSHDQFVICLPHTDKKGAIIKAERLRRLFESADFSGYFGTKVSITVSAGVCEYPSQCHDSDELIKMAEQSLLEVRKRGVGGVQVATVSSRFVPDFVVKNGKFVPPFGG